jgi:hypothetical protein
MDEEARMRSRLQLEWRQTPHGEWYCQGAGLIVSQAGEFYAYPFAGGRRLGPFASLLEAEIAVEELCLDSAQVGKTSL